MLEGMSLGLSPRQADMFVTTTSFCEGRVAADSIYALLHRECFSLFGDELFTDSTFVILRAGAGSRGVLAT
jgi:hypothetical protein